MIALLLVLTFVAATGCGSSGIKAKENYYLYTYDAKTNSLVKMGTSLRFGDKLETFEYTFGGDELTIGGKVEHTAVPDAYTITCNEEVVALVKERYRQSLVDGGADKQTLDLYDSIAVSFTPRSQYFAYEGSLFLASSIELYHEVGKDSDSFEGVYNVDDSDESLRLRGGYMYGKDKNGEYTEKKGYYTVSRGILTLTSTNEDGTDLYVEGVLYRKRYLMAKITIPEDGNLLGTDFDDQLDSSAFVKSINARKSEYSGKTITVLAEKFFARKI